MYATIRKYTMTNSRELASRVEEEFVPTLRDIPGFVAYYWIDQGDGTNATVTICDDRTAVTSRRGERPSGFARTRRTPCRARPT